MKKRWHLTACPALSLRDRLRLLFGVPLFVRFESPDGEVHAACNISVSVQREWPADAQVLGGWPPLIGPLPPPPPPPHPSRDPGR
jgi:hypothetical protein